MDYRILFTDIGLGFSDLESFWYRIRILSFRINHSFWILYNFALLYSRMVTPRIISSVPSPLANHTCKGELFVLYFREDFITEILRNFINRNKEIDVSANEFPRKLNPIQNRSDPNTGIPNVEEDKKCKKITIWVSFLSNFNLILFQNLCYDGGRSLKLKKCTATILVLFHELQWPLGSLAMLTLTLYENCGI